MTAFPHLGPADDVVRGLLHDQAPELAGLPLGSRHAGHDNVTIRLGDALAVRLPRDGFGARLILHEHQGLTAVGELPLPVPRTVVLGAPGPGFPHPWRVVPWLDGTPAADAVLDQPATAAALGRFLHALHIPAPADAPSNTWRGIPLAERTAGTAPRLARIGAAGILPPAQVDAVQDLLEDAATLPPWAGGPRWVHGDLHARNVLVADGCPSAVIDFGDIHGGDPAIDLVAAWFLLDPDHHRVLRAAAPHLDDDTWARGGAWALHIAAVVLDDVRDDPAFIARARRAVVNVLATHGSGPGWVVGWAPDPGPNQQPR